MKILMEIDESIAEDEVIIRCRELNDEMVSLQRQISEAVNQKMQLHVAKSDKEYFITLEEILFLETADQMIAVHTSDDIYATKQKMYELEELLPGSFMRVSKSTIINTQAVRSIHKNITGASEVEFAGTMKKAYVSRMYIKALMSKLEEKRIKK